MHHKPSPRRALHDTEVDKKSDKNEPKLSSFKFKTTEGLVEEEHINQIEVSENEDEVS